MTIEDLHALDLSDRDLRIKLGPEVHVYKCLDQAGSGQTAVTWRAIDCFGTHYALKLTPRARYQTHNIQAELSRAKKLPGRFAQIVAFGEADCEDLGIDLSDLYGIVVEWVEGDTLPQFCKSAAQTFEIEHFLKLASDLCEALALLEREGLCHRDLHPENIMISREIRGPRLTPEFSVKIIDTGTMMTASAHRDLIETWERTATALQDAGVESGSKPAARLDEIKGWIRWFSRSDQEWIVCHLCAILNTVASQESRLPGPQRQFIRDVPPIIAKMVDPDPSVRIDSAADMYQGLEAAWRAIITPAKGKLQSPFDYISAELIRSDGQLNTLFSDKCPWLERCETSDPVYIYGPRGCGKSTILRRLALSAVLGSERGRRHFNDVPFIGVYISCSSELRSRFWLFRDEQYPRIQGDVVLFFTLLLTEALLDALELLRDGVVEQAIGRSVGLSNDTAHRIFQIVCRLFELPKVDQKLQGVSWLTYARRRLTIRRGEIWKDILAGSSSRPAQPALIFDLCKELEHVFPLLQSKNIAFLIDDYSNQRIPIVLQRMLNQTISFAKQGNPIFKVTSEYQGVDLEGIQAGREVIEINLGKEYVDLADRERSLFLEDVLNIRFRETGIPTTAEQLVGRSNITPAVQMARAIRDSQVDGGGKFYYHGIDTIADICSGDVAMALDLVRHVYVEVRDKLPLQRPVPEKEQHEVIHRYSDREHMYLRYIAGHGKRIAEIAGALCRLAHECAVSLTSNKDGKAEPMIKTHLDIASDAVDQLPADLQDLLQEMQRRGILFSLDSSRSRIERKGTDRYQVRRILLVQRLAPLGRRDPIKLDNVQRLQYLLQNPVEFVDEELSGQRKMRF